MKKMFLLVCSLFSFLFLSGCSAKEEVRLSKDYIQLSCLLSEENVCLSVDFVFDKERGENRDKVEMENFKNNLVQNLTTLRNEFLLSHALKYSQNPVEEFAINKGVMFTNVSFAKENNVGFKIVYKSFEAWRYYNSSSKSKEAKAIYLIKKVESKGDFPFASNYSSGQKVGERYKEMYMSALGNLSFKEEELNLYKPDFVYDYATSSSKLRSNCDKRVYSEGLYHNIWIESEEEYKNAQIVLWQYMVNNGLIQLIIISLSVIPCLWLCIRQIKKENRFKSGFEGKK